MTHSMMKRSVAAVAFVPLMFMSIANAAHPTSVAGSWSAVGNQTTGKLSISQATSSAVCKAIRGFIFSTNTAIEGFYCPVTGRIVFVRKTGAGVPFQLYEGHVSRDAAVDRIGGSLKVWNAAGGGLNNEGVDFNFSAFK